MNKNEKQADWLDTIANGASYGLNAVMAAPKQMYDAGAEAAKNYYTHGATRVRPEIKAQYAAQQSAKANANAQNAATAAQQKVIADAAAAKLHGQELLKYTLGGLGTGLVLTRLHHILSGANKPKPKHTKVGPGPVGIEDEEKLAGEDTYTKIISAPGHLIQNFSDPANQRSARAALLFSGVAGGLYGGYSIMSQLAEKKRKQDLQDQVDAAKKEYMRALTGRKVAADLDAAFDIVGKLAEGENKAPLLNTAAWLFDKAFDPIRAAGLMEPYTITTGALGALAGKMTYDWTRARGKDKALAEARKARARLSGIAPIYVDPEQLAAVKRVAD